MFYKIFQYFFCYLFKFKNLYLDKLASANILKFTDKYKYLPYYILIKDAVLDYFALTILKTLKK